LIAVVAAAAVASTTVGAGPRPWTPGDCPSDGGDAATAARAPVPLALGDLRTVPWYRIDPRLDRSGALEGQRLALGSDGERSSQYVDLPAESFAAGPFGHLVLTGADDGTISRLAAIDVVGQCLWPIATETSVIRRATIDPAGQTVYEMRVDRETRADLGIWSRPLDGSSPPTRVLDPIAGDERFGATFTTEFAWNVSGDNLAIQSCGEAACRTRVVDTAGDLVHAIADPDLGTLIGLDQEVLVSYEACPGFPCPIVATNLSTGTRSVLADQAAVAVVIKTPDGPRLVHEVPGEAAIGLRAVAFDGSSETDLGRLPDGLRLHAVPSISEAATRIPSGWALFAPDGRLPVAGPDARTQLRHVPDGVAVQLNEVAR
jgi:hypothetical protein